MKMFSDKLTLICSLLWQLVYKFMDKDAADDFHYIHIQI